MTKRRPELVVQTLAAINVRRWSFPAVGSFSAVGGLSAGGSPSFGGTPSAGGSTVGSTFGFVSELPVVPADVVGLHSVVGGAAEAVPGVRAVAVSGLRAPVCF